MIQKLKRQEELLKRQIELENEVQQKKREDDERRLSEKKGWNKPRSRKQSGDKDQQESEPTPHKYQQCDRKKLIKMMRKKKLQ